MGACADAQVVAELPKVEIVSAGMARTGVGRSFIVLHAYFGQTRLDCLLHVGGEIVVRQIRRGRVAERRVGFERQVVDRQVRRLEAQRDIDVGKCLSQRLPRQGVHQVEVEGIEVDGGKFGCPARLAVIVDAPQCLEMARIKTLDAERDTHHTRLAEALEPGGLDRAGVGFEGDLGAGNQLRQGANAAQDAVDSLGRKQAGGAATEEDGVDPAAPDVWQGTLEVGQQGVDVGSFGNSPLFPRV